MDTYVTCIVPAVAAEERWTRWRDQAEREGFVSALAAPARVTHGIAVALNLYSRQGDPWDDALLTAADAYAQLIAVSVRVRLRLAALEDSAVGFYRSASDAVTVERAVGAIMQTNQCSEDEARRIVESASRHRNVSPREVAETMLRALVVPTPQERADR